MLTNLLTYRAAASPNIGCAMRLSNLVVITSLAVSLLLTSKVGRAAASSDNSNLLTNPSFEQEAMITDESSLPGWEFWFRRSPDEPKLTADEVAVVDDPQLAHSGRRFLRIRPLTRDIVLRSPRAAQFEPGLYEVSLWVRGRPGTIAGLGLESLGVNFGAGIQGVNDQWQKFSMVLYSKGVSGHIPFPEHTQLQTYVFRPGERGQNADATLDIDDVSIVRLTSGLADTLSDHMVLQRDRPVPIRGWAKAPGQSVTVAFNGQTKTATADKEGHWQAELQPMKAGGPYVLTLDGRPTAFDVMVGDVWICSGQSNMEMGIDLLNGYFNHAPKSSRRRTNRKSACGKPPSNLARHRFVAISPIRAPLITIFKPVGMCARRRPPLVAYGAVSRPWAISSVAIFKPIRR